MSQYRIELPDADPAFLRRALSLPGVKVSRDTVLAPSNAAWLVLEWARAAGVLPSYVGAAQTDGDPLASIEELTLAGLREWVPDFLTEYQRAGILEMAHRSGHLWWAAGCLVGDTEVVVNRGGAARRMRLDHLVAKFNGARTVNPRNGVESAWDLSIPTYTQSVDEQTGHLVKNRIVGAVYSGEKQVFRIQTESGHMVCATKDHKFWTPSGWAPLEDLSLLNSLMVESWPEAASAPTSKSQYVQVDHMWNHPNAVRSEYKRADRPGIKRQARVPLHRLMVEAHQNGMSLHELIGRIVMGDAGDLAFLDSDTHVHHIDGNPKNNDLSNLSVLSAADHLRLHGKESGWKHVAGRAVPSKIVGIEPLGTVPTYDLMMESPHNSFVANGIVVHNSGKTAGAICWSLAHPGRTVIVTRAGVRRSHGREVERLTTHRAFVIEESKGRPATEVVKDLEASGAQFAIVGWEGLPDVVDDLLAWRPRNLILDELHRGKSPKRWTAVPTESGRVKFDAKDNIAYAAYQLSRACPYRLGTTATPIKDRVRDLWAQLDLIHPEAWGRFYAADKPSFAGRYCAARAGEYGGIDTSGSSNLDELWNRVSVVVHQVPHSETHRHLPPRRRLVTYVTQDEQCRPEGFTQGFFKQAAKGGHTGLLEARLMEAAAKKRKVLISLVEEAVAVGQKVVVFTGRREDCDRLADDIRKAVGTRALVLAGHGGTSAAERDRIQQTYMAQTLPTVLVGTGDAWGECLDIDTMILGANKSLRDCVDGDRVFGETRVGPSESATIHPYTGHMVEIRAQGLLPMRSTAGHATLTMAGGITTGRDRHFEFRSGREWKNAEDVKPWIPNTAHPAKTEGDFLLVPRLDGTHTGVRFDLRRFAASPGHATMCLSRGCPQELVLDADTAWVLGLYAAEGSSTVQPTGQVRVTFSLGSHERHLADRVVAIMSARGFKVSVRQQETWLHITIKSTLLGRLLHDLMGQGAENKRIPEEVLLNTDLELVRTFIQGYADGDGHAMEGGRKVQAATVSKVLALQLQLALARFGRLASVVQIQSKPGQIGGRAIKHRHPTFIVTWRWVSVRHDRYKVLDKYIATPVKSVKVTPFSGNVGYMSTADKTMLASNAIVHNGVNLQDTDLALIAMLPYTPGQIVQWEGRFCRHGQKRPVLIQYLICENTVDEHVAGIMLDKLPAVESVSREDSLEGFADSLLGIDDEDSIIAGLIAKL